MRRRGSRGQAPPREAPVGPRRGAAAPPLDDRGYARLPTEAVLPAARELDRLPTRRVVDLLVREERRSVAAVRAASAPLARAAEAVATALAAGGRLIYVGAGTSGRLATLDAAECPPTFATRPGQVVAVHAGGPRALRRPVEGAEDRADDARRALRRLRVSAADVVVGVAASGVTPFTRAGLEEGRRAGAFVVLVTCAPGAARATGAAAVADVVVGLQVGPEVLAGSTRLKAGTATKVALNALSTAAMVRLGKCLGPFMVDVRPTSAKLRARARRLVGRLTGRPPDEAETLLRDAGGDVKTAVVMGRLGLDRAAARRRLRAAAGRLRAALERA